MCKLGLGPVPSIWLAKKFLCFFSHRSALVALSQLSLTSFETILLDCIVTAVISASSKKKNLPKLVTFCVAILILKKEENTHHFQHIMFYYSKKGKNAAETHTQKVVCSVWRRCCD